MSVNAPGDCSTTEQTSIASGQNHNGVVDLKFSYQIRQVNEDTRPDAELTIEQLAKRYKGDLDGITVFDHEMPFNEDYRYEDPTASDAFQCKARALEERLGRKQSPDERASA